LLLPPPVCFRSLSHGFESNSYRPACSLFPVAFSSFSTPPTVLWIKSFHLLPILFLQSPLFGPGSHFSWPVPQLSASRVVPPPWHHGLLSPPPLKPSTFTLFPLIEGFSCPSVIFYSAFPPLTSIMSPPIPSTSDQNFFFTFFL